MEEVSHLDSALLCGHDNGATLDTRVLRSRLINLLLDWELQALALDAKRYKIEAPADRDALREHATVYRHCIAELSQILGTGHPAKRKNDQAHES